MSATAVAAGAMALLYGVADAVLIAAIIVMMGVPVLTIAHLIARIGDGSDGSRGR